MSEEIKVFRKDDRLSSDEILAFFSKRVIVSGEESEYRSYEETNIRLSVDNDASLNISDQHGRSFVYFYADQLDHLQAALEVALKQRAAIGTEEQA